MSNTLRPSWSLLQWAEVIHLIDQFNLCCCTERTVQKDRAVWWIELGKRMPFEIDQYMQSFRVLVRLHAVMDTLLFLCQSLYRTILYSIQVTQQLWSGGDKKKKKSVNRPFNHFSGEPKQSLQDERATRDNINSLLNHLLLKVCVQLQEESAAAQRANVVLGSGQTWYAAKTG